MPKINISQVHPESSLTVSEQTPADRHPVLVYIASLTSQHSRRNMTRYLHQIASLLTNDRQNALAMDWAAVRYQHVAFVRTQLMDTYAPSTINGMLSALRGVLKETWRLGYMDAETYHRAVDVENVTGETIPTGRDIKAGEFLALAQACYDDESAAGIRDSAIIGILYTGGLRRSEVVNLALDDFEADTGQIKIIGGKRRKDRTVYITNGAFDALVDWLAIRGDHPGPIFHPINKGGKVNRAKGMTGQAVYDLLKKRAVQGGVSDFKPHDFRRTFVGDMLDRGVDIATVANIAGHASVNTTRRYDRRPEEIKRQAAGKLHYPYKRREMH